MSRIKPNANIFASRSTTAAADMRARMEGGAPAGEGAHTSSADSPRSEPFVRTTNPHGLRLPDDQHIRRVDTSEALAQLTVGSVAEIALHLIGETKDNARVFYLASDIDKTATSMQKDGQFAIATGWVEDGKVLLKDGQKRARSARAGGLPYLKVEIVAKPPRRQAYIESRKMNTERSEQTSLDDAIRWSELLEDKTFADQADLAAALETSVPTVSKTLAINDIPLKLLHRMKESSITSSLRVAYEISRIFQKDNAAVERDRLEIIASEVIDDVIKRELTSAATKTLIESRLGEKKRRIRSEVREVRFGEVRGHLKIAGEKGALDLSFRNLSADQMSTLTSLVETTLANGAGRPS